MFKNCDRGLSNALYWFFEVRNKEYNMENYHNVLKVKLKKSQTLRTAVFGPHKRGTNIFILTFVVSETSTKSSTIKFSVRIGSAVFIFVNNGCEIDLSGNNSWKIHITILF